MSAEGQERRAAPEISVVVVNYNAGDYLRECLASLAQQTFQDFEVVVIDNDSRDGSMERLDLCPPRTLLAAQGRNTGFAEGNNIGARLAAGRWLALLNPDAVAEPDWLEKLLAAVRARPEHRVVASLQMDLADPGRLDGAGDCYLAYGFAWRGGFGHPARAAPPAGLCFAPCGAATFLPRDLFLEAGGFDERYFCYHEDVDLGFRLRLMGESCQFDPACRVRHAGSATSGRHSDFSVFHGSRNAVWTYVKNMPAGLLVLTLPVFLAMTVALIVRASLAGRGPATVRGLAASISGLGAAWRSRRFVLQRRRALLADIVGALAWNPLAFLQRRPVVRPFRSASAVSRVDA
jgi:GT2 family glycosyltransferase